MSQKRVFILISLVLAIILAGCSGWLTAIRVTDDLTINPNGSWELVMQPTFSKDVVDLNASLIEPTIQSMLEMLKPEGVNGTWRKVSTDKEGNITYRITLSGEDVATLNEHIFEDTSALTKQQNGKATTWQLRLTPSNNLFADAGEWKFTLHVGKILTSNGDQKGSTVVWTNPQQTLTADFKTGGSSSWLTILLIVLGVLILAGVVVFIVLSSKKKKPAAGMPLPSGNTCVKCGYPLADNIVYCPRCGTMRTVRQQAPAPMPVQTPVPPAVQAPTRQAGQPAPKYFCGKCGNELAEGVIYCPRCGTKRDGLPPSAKPPKFA